MAISFILSVTALGLRKQNAMFFTILSQSKIKQAEPVANWPENLRRKLRKQQRVPN